MIWYVAWLGCLLVGWMVFFTAVDPMERSRQAVAGVGALVLMIGGAISVVATNQDVSARYCTAELALAKATSPLPSDSVTVEYLRENRECVDVVLDNEEVEG